MRFHVSGEELSQWLHGVDPHDPEEVATRVAEAVAFRARLLQDEANDQALVEVIKDLDRLEIQLATGSDDAVAEEADRILKQRRR